MGRTALHSSDIKIEQKADISGDTLERDGEIVVAEQLPDADWAESMKFNEEPVTIRLEPSSDKNAATSAPVWVNGVPAEVFQNGRWMPIGYLPVGRNLIVKRKVLEVLVRAKLDTVHTKVQEPDSERPNNVIERFTSALHSFSVIEDKNPKGAGWLTELRRRNF
jgi:hypothetical protein